MLEVLITACLATALPQGGTPTAAAAVAVRGDTELTPAEAFASAVRQAEQHVRERWSLRAADAVAARKPFWLPEPLAARAVERWLADLPLEQSIRVVDREDRERVHEFGNSYQTTLWVAEEPGTVHQAERQLLERLRHLEHRTAMQFGGVAAAWLAIVVAITWLDRLSRGYMTATLRVVGLAAGAAVPAVLFLV